MADIFISYKSERKPAAAHLAEVLGAYGFDVWYDHNLFPGHEYEPRLLAELHTAKSILVLWCALAVGSEWVRKEARIARQRNVYVPCWIEKVALPDEFAGGHTLSLVNWDASPGSGDLLAIAQAVGKVVGKEANVNTNKAAEIDAQWRRYGSPTLSGFSLGPPILARIEPPISTGLRTPTLQNRNGSRFSDLLIWTSINAQYATKTKSYTRTLNVLAGSELLEEAAHSFAGTPKFVYIQAVLEEVLRQLEVLEETQAVQLLAAFEVNIAEIIRSIEAEK